MLDSENDTLAYNVLLELEAFEEIQEQKAIRHNEIQEQVIEIMTKLGIEGITAFLEIYAGLGYNQTKEVKFYKHEKLLIHDNRMN